MNLRAPIVCTLLFWLTTVHAGSETFGSEADFLAASIPDSVPYESLTARGDLNGDGKEDAAVVAITGSGGGKYRQLFVLVGDGAGQFAVAASSAQTQIPGAGCCWTESVEIEHGSIYVQNHAGTYSDKETAVHQFKLYKGTWRLVGVNISNWKSSEPEEDTVRDTNVLTGRTNHSSKLVDKPERRWTTRQPAKIYLLRDYDFFNGFGAH